jgi:hypothetical protein
MVQLSSIIKVELSQGWLAWQTLLECKDNSPRRCAVGELANALVIHRRYKSSNLGTHRKCFLILFASHSNLNLEGVHSWTIIWIPLDMLPQIINHKIYMWRGTNLKCTFKMYWFNSLCLINIGTWPSQ